MAFAPTFAILGLLIVITSFALLRLNMRKELRKGKNHKAAFRPHRYLLWPLGFGGIVAIAGGVLFLLDVLEKM